MTALYLANLAVFCVQLAAVVAVAALVAALLRLESPRAMLAFWQGVLGFGLLLPLAQWWRGAEGVPLSTTAVGEGGGTASVWVGPIDVVAPVAVALVVAGVAVRLAWLAVGAVGIARMRRRARPLDLLPPAIEEARALAGVRASVAVLDGLSRPCTFGLVRPVVLLPAALLELPEAEQRAVVYHELEHVRRRDWALALVEEVVRAALWFHPAIWWLIGRIQLTREQVVDREVVRALGARRPYIEALVRMATAGGASSRLAPSFLRESQLARRVELISKEVSMSNRRLTLSLAAAALAVIAGGVVSVQALPLYVPALPGDGEVKPVHKVQPVYPLEAREQRIEGLVRVEAVIDKEGTVVDATATDGPEALRQAAVDAMRQWRFSNGTGKTVALTVSFQFTVK